MSEQELLERITISPDVMAGKPVIQGTRLTVRYILEVLGHGATIEEILNEYEGITSEDIRACFLFAAKLLGSTEFMSQGVEAASADSEHEESAQPVHITHPVILIRINRQFRPGMSAEELYDSTRGVWRVSQRRERAKYAFAVFRGVVCEVYEIDAWHPAGSTVYKTGRQEDMNVPGRWEFTGRRAGEFIRSQYVGKSVKAYLPWGLANPVVYVNA
ncbi:MAG TPA: DUF433 domain-containing protein [Pyrinomonadaceae bacterium]|nr:DUF433 domain-containing protein [Pyrinomonadaceae bacterium]